LISSPQPVPILTDSHGIATPAKEVLAIMPDAIDRPAALDLLRRHIDQDNLVKHCLASEAIMRSLARRFDEDPDRWGLMGLLHDLDFEETKDAPDRHGDRTAEILRGEGVPDDVIAAIREHNAEGLGIARESRAGIALSCAETVTGLIVATALVNPERSLAAVKPSSVRKRMKKKDFARSVSRERIRECERIDIELDEFLTLSVEAMRGISDDLGL
jgi:putative nucleotidyltransferase with HDIG domain